LSPERGNIAEAETLGTRRRQHVRHRYARWRRSAGVEGPITSERNASEPERSHVRPQAAEPTGPHREGEEPKPMMHGHEKSDSAIVATKPPNKAGDRQRRRWSEGRRPRRTRPDAARAGPSAGKVCHRRRSAYGRPRGQPSIIRGGSRMQESCTYGSVRGAPSNGRPYRNRAMQARLKAKIAASAACRRRSSEAAVGGHQLRRKAKSRNRTPIARGTGSSNPFPSSGDSAANLWLHAFERPPLAQVVLP
jgi:hypothetical protein